MLDDDDLIARMEAHEKAKKPRVAVIMPHRNGQGNIGAGQALAAAFKTVDYVHVNEGHSLLTFCFNRLWAKVLNLRATQRITHIAMLHNDVCPDAYWGDVLLEEMNATGADMISAVVPIKDERGVTSTCVEDAADAWSVRRLTMHEVYRLPETFGAEDIVWHGPNYGRLLLNTGCWLVSLRWRGGLGRWEYTAGPVTGHRPWFRQQDRIVTLGGSDVAQTMPEDWDWSRQLQDLGLKVMATRKVALYHEQQQFTNAKPWGTWQTDLGYLQWKKQEAEATRRRS